MQYYFTDTYFDGWEFLSNVRFALADGKIHSLQSNTTADGATRIEGMVVPAFIDIQVNGGGGIQFNEHPNAESLIQMVDAHLRTGSGSIMPTLITDDIAVMHRGADAIAQARKSLPYAIPGVHFEGPHLSNAKKGMHSAAHIRPVSQDEMAIFCRQDLGQVMVTVAPESMDESAIKALTDAGVIVSLGHSNASYHQAQTSYDAGATAATHLYNAMSPLSSREPGMVGAALYNRDVYCGLIVDHVHVHPVSASLAIRLKGDDKIMLVTDAMAPAASDIDHFVYQGVKVVRQGTSLTLTDGTIAGSVLTMIEAVQNTHQDLAITLSSVLKMATSTPATLLGKADVIGGLQPGHQANLLVLDNELNITSCWRDGKML